jgi:cholesterol transport system auxiliary component
MAAGLALALASCGGATSVPTFDLTAPRSFPHGSGTARGQLVVAEPSALAVLDSDKIMVRPSAGQIATLAGARWSDRLPKLLQQRILQAFENASRLRAVGHPGDRLSADFQLVIDIRAFNMAPSDPPAAEVELAAKLVSERGGRIVAARVFRALVPAEGTDGPAATAALDAAFARVAVELVLWATKLI